MYQVNLLNSAKKDLKKLDKRFQKKAIFVLRLLKTNPLLGEKMEGELKGWFRIKIPPLRIIYTPDFKNKIIWIRAIGLRGAVYK
jgi:mRNA-degrading endonuclease RelE of RelBE toxin-antitoxin system